MLMGIFDRLKDAREAVKEFNRKWPQDKLEIKPTELNVSLK
jgi:hypothetical protein